MKARAVFERETLRDDGVEPPLGQLSRLLAPASEISRPKTLGRRDPVPERPVAVLTFRAVALVAAHALTQRTTVAFPNSGSAKRIQAGVTWVIAAHDVHCGADTVQLRHSDVAVVN